MKKSYIDDMGIYVNPVNANFRFSLNSPIYVDKSMLIAEMNRLMNTEKRFVCVSRARRFGKTMAESMLAAYFSKGCDSRELFKGLKIANDPSFEKNLNKFNVIFLDVNGIFSANPPDTDIVPVFSAKIRRELQEEFPNAHIKDSDGMPECMLKVYASNGEQFVVIMDEYDVLVREKVKDSVFKPYLTFLNTMFKNVNLMPAIALAYLTGIFPIVRDRVQSKLNVFTEYTMVGSGRLAEFVGFTSDEVQALCKQYDLDFEECKRWYDGYNINGIEIYNPKSIVDAAENGEIESYWTQTGSYDALMDYILMDLDGILQDVKFMIGGGRVDVDVTGFMNTMTDFRTKDDVFTYLIHLGYLAYDRKEKQCYIPNGEVRGQWILSIRLSPDYKIVYELVRQSKELVQRTIELDSDAVAVALDKAHEQICNNLNYNNEGTFQAVICLAYFYANTKYTIVKELPAGKGVADVVMIPYVPNVPALIIELKRNKCEQTALAQIREKRYGAALEKYSGDLLFVGVNYDEDTKEHKCVIEKFVK